MEPTNIKDNKRVSVTHGELYFQPIAHMPKGKRQSFDSFVIGHSETGHHHVLTSEKKFDLIEGTDRTILLKDVAKLFHKKEQDVHETQVLAPGAYKVYYKKEYNPFKKIVERVWD